LVSLTKPTREMVREAAASGVYETGGMKVPKVQLLTIAELLDGKKPQVPFGFIEGFRTAPREKRSDQGQLL
jgi:site-specific DNA-methyltransferase (adenine-specific)